MSWLYTLLPVFLAVPLGHGVSHSGSARQSKVVDPVRVVATLPVYASLTREIGGDEVEVTSIANPNEDSHFVRPRPSFARDLRQAELFITTGLDLELWVPVLLDRASNRDVSEGGRGYVTAHTGVTLLDIPSAVDRSGGDVHIFGNPHLTTDPLRTLQVARNITTGLIRVAPDRRGVWESGLEAFQGQIYERLFGPELVELLGGETLEELAKGNALIGFLEENEIDGTPLIERLGGWLGEANGFRGRDLICYHKNWSYLEERFGVRCVDFVEAKPGIPPSPAHVAHLVERMTTENIRVVLAASYFDSRKVEAVTRRSNGIPVIVPMNPGATEGVGDYFSLVDRWVTGLSDAFAAAGAG